MLTHGRRYRLKTATIAVVVSEGRKNAEMIPEGAIVKVVNMPAAGSSLSVDWAGNVCEMFKQDLLERGEQVRAESAGRRLPF